MDPPGVSPASLGKLPAGSSEETKHKAMLSSKARSSPTHVPNAQDLNDALLLEDAIVEVVATRIEAGHRTPVTRRPRTGRPAAAISRAA